MTSKDAEEIICLTGGKLCTNENTSQFKYFKINSNKSIHLEDFLICNESYQNQEINEKWSLVKNIRKVATGAIEKIREEKIIRSSLEAHLELYLSKVSINKFNTSCDSFILFLLSSDCAIISKSFSLSK